MPLSERDISNIAGDISSGNPATRREVSIAREARGLYVSKMGCYLIWLFLVVSWVFDECGHAERSLVLPSAMWMTTLAIPHTNRLQNSMNWLYMLCWHHALLRCQFPWDVSAPLALAPFIPLQWRRRLALFSMTIIFGKHTTNTWHNFDISFATCLRNSVAGFPLLIGRAMRMDVHEIAIVNGLGMICLLELPGPLRYVVLWLFCHPNADIADQITMGTLLPTVLAELRSICTSSRHPFPHHVDNWFYYGLTGLCAIFLYKDVAYAGELGDDTKYCLIGTAGIIFWRLICKNDEALLIFRETGLAWVLFYSIGGAVMRHHDPMDHAASVPMVYMGALLTLRAFGVSLAVVNVTHLWFAFEAQQQLQLSQWAFASWMFVGFFWSCFVCPPVPYPVFLQLHDRMMMSLRQLMLVRVNLWFPWPRTSTVRSASVSCQHGILVALGIRFMMTETFTDFTWPLHYALQPLSIYFFSKPAARFNPWPLPFFIPKYVILLTVSLLTPTPLCFLFLCWLTPVVQSIVSNFAGGNATPD